MSSAFSDKRLLRDCARQAFRKMYAAIPRFAQRRDSSSLPAEWRPRVMDNQDSRWGLEASRASRRCCTENRTEDRQASIYLGSDLIVPAHRSPWDRIEEGCDDSADSDTPTKPTA